MLKIFISFAILLLVQATNSENSLRINAVILPDITTIVLKRTNVTVACNNSCNFDSLLWTYKPSNERTYEDLLVMGSGSIRNKIPGRKDQWFKVINDTNCRRSLLLSKIQFEAAGVYACWEGLVVKRVTNVIVVNVNKCSIEPEFPDSENIILKQNDSVTIKCSFQYSADESCIVTPIWTDLTGYRNLAIPGDDFEVNMDDKHAWIHFKPDPDLRNGTRFNLSFSFNCSFTNISDNNQSGQRGRYDFGLIPIKLFIEGSAYNELNDHKMNVVNILFTVAINIAIAIVIFVFLFLVFLKTFSKLCFAHNHERTNNGAVASGISAGYIEIRKDLQPEDSNVYEVIADANYESIDDPSRHDPIEE